MILLTLVLGLTVSSLAQTSSDDACNGTIVHQEGSEGTIASLNYPNGYSIGMFCRWRIQAPNNTRIAIRFESLFDVESSAFGFCYDFVEFEEQFTQFCGSTPPSAFVSDYNVLTVNFYSDGSITRRGFSFNWTAVDSSLIPDPVFVNVTADEGQVTSPGHPINYGPFLDMTWIITATPGKVIHLEFNPIFGIGEDNSACPYDRLIIFEGSTSPQQFAFSTVLCGSSLSTTSLVFFDSTLFVRFTTDAENSGIGFSFNFSAIDPPTCDGVSYQNGTSGVIETPFYPQRYLSGMNCTWIVNVPDDYVIAVRFDSGFSLLSSYACSSEYLQVFDGQTQFLHNFCEDRAPRNFVTTGNSLIVTFISASFMGRTTGFSISWEAEKKCQSGEFTCWNGYCINETLACDGSIDCPEDIGDEASCAEESSEICGVTEVAPEFKWHSRIVGGYEAVEGSWPWQARISIILDGVEYFVCGASVLNEEWILTAAHCITTGVDETIVTLGDHNRLVPDPDAEQRINVDKIIVHSNYNWSHPEGFYEGYDVAVLHLSMPANFTKRVKPICLSKMEPEAGEDVIITGWGRTKFTSDAGLSDVLRQVAAEVIDRTECSELWEFAEDLSNSLICASIPETGGASACNGDSGGPVVTLQNGTWAVVGVVSFGSYCGETKVPAVYVNVYSVLPFINNAMTNGLTQVPVVEYVIRDQTNGTIMPTTNGNGKYASGQHTRWFLTVGEGQLIQLRFDDTFRIEQNQYGQPCGGDYLYVYDGGDMTSRKYGDKPLCGYSPPLDMESQTNQVIIEFVSDLAFEDVGFIIYFQAVDGCASDEVRCWNQSCLPKSRKCDGVPDCPSQIDEYECVLATNGSSDCGKQEIAPEFPFTPLIVGGNNAKQSSWPWQVAMYVSYGGKYQFNCGGTLISEYWVLTAAHCLGAPMIQIVAGEYSLSQNSAFEKRINVIWQLPHPDYIDIGRDDIALLRLETPVDFSFPWFKPVCLPKSDNMDPPVGSQCVTTGWGRQDTLGNNDIPDVLQQLPVHIMNDSLCQSYTAYADSGRPATICTGYADEDVGVCFGDSGGPLVCQVDGRWVQYGITSYIISYCGNREFFERTSNHIDFIRYVVEELVPCEEVQIQHGEHGMISPPTLGGRYINSLDCSWLIRGPPNTVIVVRFDYFDLEYCGIGYGIYDFVNIYDGNSTSARQVFDEMLCRSSQTLRGFESSTNEVLVTFFSDSSYNGAGFQISWEAVEDCTDEEFRCWSGTCIRSYMKCDGISDCEDSSDEKECPVLDGECGKQEIVPEFLWHSRIAGGHFARNGSWPFVAQILSYGSFACAGTIIDSRYILTSASCVTFSTPGELQVVVGTVEKNPFESEMHYVRSIQFPEPSVPVYDQTIALLELENAITFSTHVQPACLALPDISDDLHPGEQCVALGWGSTAIDSTEFLRQVLVPILGDDICNFTATDLEKQFCGGDLMGGVGTCAYDNGGPVVCFRDNVWIQPGIITNSQACGTPGSIDVFTKVSAFINWIEEATGLTLPKHEVPTRGGTGEILDINPEMIVDRHNKFRRLVGASNMIALTWDQTLAEEAEDYASKCHFAHDSDTLNGENIFVTSIKDAEGSFQAAINSWHSEIIGYSYDMNNCTCFPCGNYTQLIWAETQRVGCSVALCSSRSEDMDSKTLVVCRYSPPGNHPGQKPYRKGEPCSECHDDFPNCDNHGLCIAGCPAQRPSSCSAEYQETLSEYLEIMEKYKESFEKWKDAVDL